MDWDAIQQAGCNVQLNAPLREVTTFRLGGPCRALVSCSDEQQLVAAVNGLYEAGEQFLLIGGGSNVVISDKGLDTAVVRYCSDTCDLKTADNHIEVPGAASLDELARLTVEMGLDGLVYASGIPGTVGGAIVGNAGAYGEQIGDRVLSVKLMDHTGQMRIAPGAELGFKYRMSKLHDGDEIVVSATLGMEPGGSEELAKRREEILAERREKHPDWHTTPTAGSFFRNIEPTSAAERRQAAGWFLEQAGAKEMCVGGARVFEKHANIIVGSEKCTAKDVLELSRNMAEAVEAKFNIRLMPEVRAIGEI